MGGAMSNPHTRKQWTLADAVYDRPGTRKLLTALAGGPARRIATKSGALGSRITVDGCNTFQWVTAAALIARGLATTQDNAVHIAPRA